MKISRSLVQRDFSYKKTANFNERLTDAEILQAIRYFDGVGRILGICITLITGLAGAFAYVWLYTRML